MKLYKFREQPESFLMMLENNRSYDAKLGARFSDHPLIFHTKEYYPSLLAIYKTIDVLRMYDIEQNLDDAQIRQDYPWF